MADKNRIPNEPISEELKQYDEAWAIQDCENTAKTYKYYSWAKDLGCIVPDKTLNAGHIATLMYIISYFDLTSEELEYVMGHPDDEKILDDIIRGANSD